MVDWIIKHPLHVILGTTIIGIVIGLAIPI